MHKHEIPKAGDIWWISFEPHSGVEEAGHNLKHGNYMRPAVILSNSSYNRYGMVALFPITSNSYMSDYLIKVRTIHHKIHGFIIPFKLQGMDFISRHGEYADHIQSSLWKTLDKFINAIFQR